MNSQKSLGVRHVSTLVFAGLILSTGPLRASDSKAGDLGERAQRSRTGVGVGSQGRPFGEAGATTITAQKRLLLDSQGKEATFWGDVKVVDPRFSLACEKLTIFFRDAKGVATALEGKDAKEGRNTQEPRESSADGALEKAVAEGDVVIFQEKANGNGDMERSVGRAQKAVFDANTGNITLSGWPQVEQKQNTIVALDEATVILLNRKGTLEVLGHSKSVLRNSKSDNGR